jgi:polysaccharide export outer membrane protein
MLKRISKQSRQAARIRAAIGLMLGVFALLPARGQQSSTMVNSDIEQSKSALAKRLPQGNTNGLMAVPEGFDKLKLSPGDLLQMEIYDTPEMSSQLRIDVQGVVTIPLIGPVRVEGDTVPQAQNLIAKLLVDKQILKNPQVNLNVLEFSSKYVSVLGEVQSPGHMELLVPETLGDILSLAGGETIQAGSDIEIQHPSDNGEVSTRHIEYVQGKDSAPLRSVTVDPGDTVLVHRAGVIYVLGAVNKPGGYLMADGGSLSVIEAVTLAGGTSLQASTRWAVIVRRQDGGLVQFKVPLGKMETGGAPPFQLELNDALYVPISTLKAALINGSNVLSAATSAAIYRAP